MPYTLCSAHHPWLTAQLSVHSLSACRAWRCQICKQCDHNDHRHRTASAQCMCPVRGMPSHEAGRTCRGSLLTSARQCALFTADTADALSRPVLGRCGPWHRSTCTADTAEHHAHSSPCWECIVQQASIPISLCDLMVVAQPASSCSHYRPASEGRLRMVSCSMHVPLTATMWCLGPIASPWGRICRGRWWRPEAGPG